MKTAKTITATLALLLVFSLCAFGQATTSSTTASAAITATASEIYVASAAGIAAPAQGVSIGTILVAGQERMDVRAVSGTKITVIRGQGGTRSQAHASGAVIWVGSYNYFANQDPPEGGACTATAEVALPLVVPTTGHIWQCASSLWVRIAETRGTANTGVTAVEYAGGGKHNVTKLTFTDLSIGAAVGAADLAFGKLLYTLPAGVVSIRSASYSIALTGSGATCDADTPDAGLGTVIGSGAVAVLGGTATFEDILTGQTVNDLEAAAEVKTVVGQPVAIEAAAAHTVHLNIADGWAGACTVTATGTVWVEWSHLN